MQVSKYIRIGILLLAFGIFVPAVTRPLSVLSNDAMQRKITCDYSGKQFHAELNEYRFCGQIGWGLFVSSGICFIFAGSAVLIFMLPSVKPSAAGSE